MRLIILDEFRFVRKLFWNMINFWSLAQFRVDSLFHPSIHRLVSILIWYFSCSLIRILARFLLEIFLVLTPFLSCRFCYFSACTCNANAVISCLIRLSLLFLILSRDLYWCIYAGESSSFFFSWYLQPVFVISWA